MNEALNLKLLPGEPTDGTGRLRIHFLVEDPNGPIETKKSLIGPDGTLALQKDLRFDNVKHWRIACNAEQNSINPQVRNGQRYICLNSNDPLAVTCPECLKSADMVAMHVVDVLKNVKAEQTVQALGTVA